MSRMLILRLPEYLKERFPLSQMVPLSLSFGLAILSRFTGRPWLIVSSMLFLYLFQLRLMDEFKDFAHDKKYYPNRPVPRGLINLSEISLVLIIVLITQLFLNLYIGSALGIFAVIQIYTAFMGKEFFVKEWLSKHFALYILSHEVITPALFIYLFLLTTTPITFQSIVTSLTLSINLFLLEIGRKLKPREPSREANDTYLERFGLRGVALLIFTLTLVSAIFVKSISGSNVSWLPLATLPIMWIYLNKYFSQGWQKYSPTLFVIVISFVLVSNLVLFIS